MRENFTFLRGSAQLRVQGKRPERILNLLTEAHIRFWNMEKSGEDTLTFRVVNDKARMAEKLCENAGLKCTRIRGRGLPYVLKKVKKRYVLLTLPVLLILFVLYLSLLVWNIDITGNETVSRAAILRALNHAGLEIGTFTLQVDRELVRSRVIEEIPELSWVSIQINGSRVVVDVRERTPKPDIVDIYADVDVRAAKSGLITKMNVLQGKPLVKVGDTVLAGELLVSGTMDSSYGDTRFVHAQAEIYARTWYEFSASMPLWYIAKRYSGEEISKRAITIGDVRTNLYWNSGSANMSSDKQVSEAWVELPLGIVLPVRTVQEVYRPYEPTVVELDAEIAQAELEQSLMSRLLELAPDAEIVSITYTPVVDGDILTVTLSAECLERIDMETQMQGQTDTQSEFGES